MVYDEDWQIGVGICEFVEELLVEGAVDGGPKGCATVEDCCDVLGIRCPFACQYSFLDPEDKLVQPRTLSALLTVRIRYHWVDWHEMHLDS